MNAVNNISAAVCAARLLVRGMMTTFIALIISTCTDRRFRIGYDTYFSAFAA